MTSSLKLAGLIFCLPIIASGQTWPDKNTVTPNLVQTDFGPNGAALPLDGSAYCGPTSAAMALGYLNEAGFTQLLGSPVRQEDYLNLVRVMSGLMGSSDSGGTGAPQPGLSNYFSAKGIGPENRALTAANGGYHRTLSQIAAQNSGQNILIGVIGWYQESNGVWDRNGGHFIVITDQDPGYGSLTIHNPYPFSLLDQPNLPANVLQTTPMTTFSGKTNSGLGESTYLQFNTSQVGPLSASAPTLGILEQVYTIHVDASQLPSSGFTPKDWTIHTMKTLNTGGGDLVVDTQVTGAGGFNKTDEGHLVFREAVTLSGNHTIRAGGMISQVTTGDAFGTGSIVLSGTGTLKFHPLNAESGAVRLKVASHPPNVSGEGGQLSYSGGNRIELRRGVNSLLDVMVGGNSGNAVVNLAPRGPAPTLVIEAEDLGGKERLRLKGGNAPTRINGIVSGNIVGSHGASKDGQFLTYSYSTRRNRGFRPAATITGDINSATSSTVYQATSNQTLTGAANVYALSVGSGLTIGGTGETLRVGDGTSAGGILLNGGTVSTGTLAFGTAQATVYTNVPGGTINAALTGSGGLVKFGPGELVLSASSPEFSGNSFVNTGTLVLRAASAVGDNATILTLRQGSSLRVDAGATIPGTTIAKGYSEIFLNGGTLGETQIRSLQGPRGPIQGATLRGHGTVTGHVRLNGYLAGDPDHGAGTLIFDGLVSAGKAAAFVWSLPNLVDNDTGTAGTDWNNLVFTNPDATFGTISQPISVFFDFGPGLDPNGGNAFWQNDHEWTLFTFSGRTSTQDQLVFLSFPTNDFPAGYFFHQHKGNQSMLVYHYTGSAKSNQ